MKKKTITGFSKLSKIGKLRWIAENFFKNPELVKDELIGFWHKDEEQQKILDGFSENTLSNYPMPYGVAPNFLINDKIYCVPMVTEESSVVAAAASAAKFWLDKGGFKATVQNMQKIGQLYFKSNIDFNAIQAHKKEIQINLLDKSQAFTLNMEERGGGVLSMEFIDMRNEIDNMYQLRVHFDTRDSMGANFINTIMEIYGEFLPSILQEIGDRSIETDILMAILSNYTPECTVHVELSCRIEDLACDTDEMSREEFAQRFYNAVKLAKIDPYRATTHNKGIFNGIDAVILATGNDFRAIEAAGHAYAARNGGYASLSDCTIDDGIFKFWLEIPLALGTVGGLTALHPIARRSLELLDTPDAEELMKIVASVGLGQNFAAIKSLVTTGIQYGHMKMHLQNILNHLKASDDETNKAEKYFEERVVSFHSVRQFLEMERNITATK